MPGGRNAVDELTRHTRHIGPGNYRQETADLKDGGAPIGFVVNSMLPADDVDQIPEVVRAITRDSPRAPQSRSSSASTPPPRCPTSPSGTRSPGPPGSPRASTCRWRSTATRSGRRTTSSRTAAPATRFSVTPTRWRRSGPRAGRPGRRGRRYPYVSIQDFDRGARTTADGTHVFDRIDRRTRFDPESAGPQDEPPARPLMISGGYRVGDTEELIRRTRERLERRARDHQARIAALPAGSERTTEQQKLAAVRNGLAKLDTQSGRDAFVRDFTTAVDEDMRSRDRQATVHPMLPYSPEPNLFVDGLLTLGRPEVRFGEAGAGSSCWPEPAPGVRRGAGRRPRRGDAGRPAGGRPHRRRPGRLAEQQASRPRPGLHDGLRGRRPPTDLSRLAADFAVGNFLPQSHAVPTNVNRQLFYTEGTGFRSTGPNCASPQSPPRSRSPRPPTWCPARRGRGRRRSRRSNCGSSAPNHTTGTSPPSRCRRRAPPRRRTSRPRSTPTWTRRGRPGPSACRTASASSPRTSSRRRTTPEPSSRSSPPPPPSPTVAGSAGNRAPYDAIAGGLPGSDADALRTSTLTPAGTR
ncbi:hypothetical protein V2I01_32370 [Micromonospora sp. BRA006-A]|nr:hypothetical protein [Micromonospora sp. BRA006-A]